MALLGISPSDVNPSFRNCIVACSGFIGTHKSAAVVSRDVERSLWTWISDPAPRSIWRTHLLHLINAVLNKHAGVLHYYQGYHDIASAVLLSCGVEDGLAFVILEKLSLHHLRDYMAPQLTETSAQLNLVLPLVRRVEAKEALQGIESISAAEAIEESQVPPFFCLSWVLTWASHVIPNGAIATSMVDVMIGYHPLLPVYISAVLVLESRRWGLGDLPRPYQMPMVHQYFGTFPVAKANVFNWLDIAQRAVQLLQEVPPERLLAEEAGKAGIQHSSVLFAYPYPWMPQHTRQPFARLSALSKAVGLVSVTSLAAAVTAYVYISQFTGT